MSRILTAMAVAVVAAGCATTGEGSYGTPESDGFDVVINVENDHWYDMRIFVEGGIGAQKILGDVPARSARTFTLPRQLVGSSSELRLIADPRGSARQLMSKPLDLARGHNLNWQLRSTGTTRLRVM